MNDPAIHSLVLVVVTAMFGALLFRSRLPGWVKAVVYIAYLAVIFAWVLVVCRP